MPFKWPCFRPSLSRVSRDTSEAKQSKTHKPHKTRPNADKTASKTSVSDSESLVRFVRHQSTCIHARQMLCGPRPAHPRAHAAPSYPEPRPILITHPRPTRILPSCNLHRPSCPQDRCACCLCFLCARHCPRTFDPGPMVHHQIPSAHRGRWEMLDMGKRVK